MGKLIARALTVCVATVTLIVAAGCSADPVPVVTQPPVVSTEPTPQEVPESDLMPDFDRLEELAQMDIADPELMDLANNQLELEALWPANGSELGAIAYAPLGDMCYLAFIGWGTLTATSEVKVELRWRYADDVPLVDFVYDTPLEAVDAITSSDDADITVCFYDTDVQPDVIEV